MASPDPSPSPPGVREFRSVKADRAFAWYSEALRLFKKHPLGFAALAFATAVAEILLLLVPLVGPPAANVVVPIVAASLLFASLATDRGDRPRASHLIAPFAAPARAVGTVIAATIVVSGFEWLAGWHLAGVNLLSIESITDIGVADLLVVYVIGVAVSLPLTLVPLFAFLEGASPRDSFAWSIAAFLRNPSAFVLYGALATALLGVVFVTQGLAAVIVLPLWAAASYAAWKDLLNAS